MVFICSPYKGDTKTNLERAKIYCQKANTYSKIPIAPHLYFTQFLDDNTFIGRADGMYMGLNMMELCDEIWVFADELSEGMIEETKKAKELNLPMKFFNLNQDEINDDNFLIHPEIGPAYKRLISENYGHWFNIESANVNYPSNCEKCPNYKQHKPCVVNEGDSVKRTDKAISSVEKANVRITTWAKRIGGIKR